MFVMFLLQYFVFLRCSNIYVSIKVNNSSNRGFNTDVTDWEAMYIKQDKIYTKTIYPICTIISRMFH